MECHFQQLRPYHDKVEIHNWEEIPFSVSSGLLDAEALQIVLNNSAQLYKAIRPTR